MTKTFAPGSPPTRNGSSRDPDWPDNGGGPGVTVLTYDTPPAPPGDTGSAGGSIRRALAGPLPEDVHDALLDHLVGMSPGAPPHDPSRTVITVFDGTRLGRVAVRRLFDLTEVYTQCDPEGPVPGMLMDGVTWCDPGARVEMRIPGGHTVKGWES